MKTVKLGSKQEESIPTLNNNGANAVSHEEKAHLLNTFSLNVGTMLNLFIQGTGIYTRIKVALIISCTCNSNEIIELTKMWT